MKAKFLQSSAFSLQPALWAALIGLLWLLTPVRVTGYDGGFYLAMTRTPFSPAAAVRTAPYAWRILPAWLLHLVPGNPLDVYTVFNALASFLTALVLVRVLRRMGLRAPETGLTVFFFLTCWVNVRFAFYNPVHIDSAYFLILAAAFWALLAERDLPFLLCLLAAACVREYFVALLPAHYFLRRRPGRGLDFPVLGRTALLAFAPLALFVSLRFFIPVRNSDFGYLAHGLYFGRMALVHWPRMIYSFFNAFGAAGVILLLGAPAAGRELRRAPWLAAYLGASLVFWVFGGVDRERILFTAWPAVLILAAAVIRRQREIYASPPVLVLLVLLQLFLTRFYLPLKPENYRLLWWSDVSFMPAAELARSARAWGLAGLAFAAVLAGTRLKKSRPSLRP